MSARSVYAERGRAARCWLVLAGHAARAYVWCAAGEAGQAGGGARDHD